MFSALLRVRVRVRVRVRLPPVLLLIIALRAVNQHVNTETSRQSFTPKKTAISQSRNILWVTLLSLGKPAIREFFDLETVKFPRFYAETTLASSETVGVFITIKSYITLHLLITHQEIFFWSVFKCTFF